MDPPPVFRPRGRLNLLERVEAGSVLVTRLSFDAAWTETWGACDVGVAQIPASCPQLLRPLEVLDVSLAVVDDV